MEYRVKVKKWTYKKDDIKHRGQRNKIQRKHYRGCSEENRTNQKFVTIRHNWRKFTKFKKAYHIIRISILKENPTLLTEKSKNKQITKLRKFSIRLSKIGKTEVLKRKLLYSKCYTYKPAFNMLGHQWNISYIYRLRTHTIHIEFLKKWLQNLLANIIPYDFKKIKTKMQDTFII